ncbi:histidine triad nucleotide-binding protein [soil metagenome]
MDCIFCAIITGDLPASVVHRTERVIAIRDINPQAPVHVLVIPIPHAPNAAATAQSDPALIGEMVIAAAAVAEQEGVTDYRLLFSTGAEAGQTVLHTHLHLLAGTTLAERLV